MAESQKTRNYQRLDYLTPSDFEFVQLFCSLSHSYQSGGRFSTVYAYAVMALLFVFAFSKFRDSHEGLNSHAIPHENSVSHEFSQVCFVDCLNYCSTGANRQMKTQSRIVISSSKIEL